MRLTMLYQNSIEQFSIPEPSVKVYPKICPPSSPPMTQISFLERNNTTFRVLCFEIVKMVTGPYCSKLQNYSRHFVYMFNSTPSRRFFNMLTKQSCKTSDHDSNQNIKLYYRSTRETYKGFWSWKLIFYYTQIKCFIYIQNSLWWKILFAVKTQ